MASMKIEVFSTTCAKCKMLDVVVRTAIQEMDIDADVTRITNTTLFKERGVSRIPALIINGKHILEGRVPTVTEMKSIIRNEMMDPSVQ
jgi:small redox-active disulfide protein 2